MLDPCLRLLGREKLHEMAPLQIEQPAVTVDGRETIPEFVRDAGRKFAKTRETVFQAQLIFEIRDLAQIGKETDCTVLVPALVADRRRPGATG